MGETLKQKSDLMNEVERERWSNKIQAALIAWLLPYFSPVPAHRIQDHEKECVISKAIGRPFRTWYRQASGSMTQESAADFCEPKKAENLFKSLFPCQSVDHFLVRAAEHYVHLRRLAEKEHEAAAHVLAA